MSAPMDESAAVLEANRRVYDTIADVYDRVDRRRSGEVAHPWLSRVFDEIEMVLSTRADGGVGPLHLLDAGAGSGFLAKKVAARFGTVTLVDASPRMLERIALPGATKICADVCAMPVAAESVDVVAAFATLHHLASPAAFFREAYRVLRPGGVLYTDHDIEATFVRRFRWPLRLYRAVFDHGRGFLRACPSLRPEDYRRSEFHGERGLDAEAIRRDVTRAGLRVVRIAFHWEGMRGEGMRGEGMRGEGMRGEGWMGRFGTLLRGSPVGHVFSLPGRAPVLRVIAAK